MEKYNILSGVCRALLIAFQKEFGAPLKKGQNEYYGLKEFKNSPKAVWHKIVKVDSVKQYLQDNNIKAQTVTKNLSTLDGAISYSTKKFNNADTYSKFYCPSEYLDVIAMSIGFHDFETFVRNLDDSDLRLQQLELVHSQKKMPKRSISLPNFLPGLYEGYFVRLQNTDLGQQEALSKLLILITKRGRIFVRTSHKLNYDGHCEYFSNPEPYLNIRFEMPETTCVYKFQIDTAVPSNGEHFQRNGKCLKGTYTGFDPINKEPVAGRILLKQTIEYDKFPKGVSTLDDTYFDKNKAQDFALKDLISFMATKSGENILHMMSQIKYHEDGQFLSSLQRRKEISNYVGLYLILYPSSDEYFINIASLKIDNFGNVEIRSNVREKSEINTENVEQISTYSGFVYLFEGIYLAIRMETKDNKPFYFQYIVHNRPTSNEASNVFQGLRVSLSKDNHPIASRVVLVKIEEKAADTLEYTRIPLFTNKSTYENFGPIRKHLNSSTFPTKLAHYLTGHIDNFIKHEVKTHTFERDNYGEILHAAACHFADKDEEKFIATLKKAKLHGYKIQIDKFKQYDWFINLSEKCLKRLFEIELLNSYAVNNAESLEN